MIKRISKYQLFTLMIIFEIGSTTLFALGIDAEQNAWIVILVAMVIGLLFAWIFTELHKSYPGKNYVEIIQSILGKWLGIPLALLYAIYWLWPAARNLREFGDLIAMTTLENTPLPIILLVFVMASVYVLSMGIGVMARTSEITMYVLVSFITGTFILVILSGVVDMRELTPVLHDGIGPVLATAYPAVAIFPFGEILIFSMIWHYTDGKEAIRKITFLSILFSGILLGLTLALYVAALGVAYTASSTIPFIELVKLINIADIITNLDALGVVIIFIGGFYKMSLFLYGMTLIISTIFKIKKFKLLLTGTALFLLFVSYYFEPNYVFHRWMNPFDTDYFYTAYLHAIPVLLLLILWVKKRIERLQ